MKRTVIHIDISDFHVAVERVLEPRLRDRPVAVAIQTATRSLVYSTSAQARQSGIFPGMPLNQALRRCRDLTVLPPNQDLYVRATQAMLEVLGQFSPVIEPLRFGHAYLDMSGSERLFGRTKDAAAKAQREIRSRLSLPTNAGVGINKLVSKVASDVIYSAGEHDALYDVNPGQEPGFLAPLQVGFLPGVKKDIRKQLLELNVRVIRELVQISGENLQMVFGRFGLVMHQRARGIDDRPVQPSRRSPEIVCDQTLDEDSNDYDLLKRLAFQLFYRATRELRRKELHTARMVLELRYSDYKEARAHERFVLTSSESILASKLKIVLDAALTRRVRVRKMTLRLSDLAEIPEQLSLFETPTDPRLDAITRAMDRIRNRYGDKSIFFGRAA